MSDSLRIHFAGRTDVGLIREHNEDNLSVVDLEARGSVPLTGNRTLTVGPRGMLLIVCDGMGGAAAGEVASAMALEAYAGHLLERTEQAPDASLPIEERRAGFARLMLKTLRKEVEARFPTDESRREDDTGFADMQCVVFIAAAENFERTADF